MSFSLAFHAGLTAIYLYLQFGVYNGISLLTTLVSVLIFTMVLWNIAASAMKRPPPPLPRILSQGIPEAQLRAYADRAAPYLNKGLSFMYRVLNGRDPMTSILIASSIYLGGKVAASVSLLTLAYLPILVLFTVPKIYEMKKDEIDRVYDSARTHATAFYDKYLAAIIEKIPRARGASPAQSSTTRVHAE